MKELANLNQKGLTGTIAFWMVIFSFVLPLCTFAFSIYWIYLLSDKIWLKSVGNNLFVSNFFMLLFSLATFIFNLLSSMKIKIVFDKMAFHLFVVLTLITFTICCLCLSMSSYKAADRAYQDFIDFYYRNPGESIAQKFFSKYNTFISQKNYILRRTVEANSSLAGIFGTWVGSFVVYIVAFDLLRDKEDGQPLLNNKDSNPDGQSNQNTENDQESNEGQSNNENNGNSENN